MSDEVNWENIKNFLNWQGTLEELKQRLPPLPVPRSSLGFTDWTVSQATMARDLYQTTLHPGSTLVGFGPTKREAAKHLAERLRELAYLVEAQEGLEARKW